MQKLRLFTLIVLANALMLPAVHGVAQADTHGTSLDSLYRLVPANWPVLIRFDASEDTASGAFLRSVDKTPEGVQVQEWTRSFEIGMTKLLYSIGLDLDPEKGMMDWMGDRAVIAVNPMDRESPGLVIAISSKNRDLAERTLDGLMASMIRDSEPVTERIGNARAHIWTVDFGGNTMHPAYAVGQDFVVFADSKERLRAALEEMANAGRPNLAAKLAVHSDDVMAFAADLTDVVKQFMPQSEASDGMDFFSALLGGMSRTEMYGGLGVNEDGILFSVNGDVPPILMLVAGPLLAGEPAEWDMAEVFPANTMAMATASSAAMLQPLRQQFSQMSPGSIPSLEAAMQMIGTASEGSVALALTGIIPRPNFVAACRLADGAKAAAMMREFRESMGERGVRVSPPPYATTAPVYQLKAGDSETSLGYLGQTRNTVFLASDWRAAQRMISVTPRNSLAGRDGYSQVKNLTDGPRMVDMWVSLEAVSALGFLYESFGTSEFMSAQLIADSLKGTKGMGVSAGLTETGAEVRMALRTTITPQSPAVAAYSGMIWGMLFGSIIGTRESYQGAQEAAHQAHSLSNLKQLALAAIIYANDNDGILPDAANWRELLMTSFGDPAILGPPYPGTAYEMNPALSGMNIDEIENPSQVVLFALIDEGQPFEFDYFAFTPSGKVEIAFVDGHVESQCYSDIDESMIILNPND